MGEKEKVKGFFIRHNGSIGIIVFCIITGIAVYTGLSKSAKLNASSKLTQGIIYKSDSKYFTFYYYSDTKRYEGHVGNNEDGKYKIGDAVVVQYSGLDPEIYILPSKMDNNTDLDKLALKQISFWDVW